MQPCMMWDSKLNQKHQNRNIEKYILKKQEKNEKMMLQLEIEHTTSSPVLCLPEAPIAAN